MRNLTKALTVVSLLAPVSSYSLGIGDIRVRSALNQNLNAEISLMVSPNEDPKSIKVGLAPSERFDAAGVSWSYFLSKVRFKPIVKPNGSVVVKVTSTEALKEPYLNFLLEVTWPKGNLYREFTVLVDPPAEYQEPTYQPVQAAPNSDAYYPQEQTYVPRPQSAIRHRAKPRAQANPDGSFGGEVLARRNDTLWKVAARAKGGSAVSVEQMMMALYENNPNAFFQPNVNALSAGKSLKVPAKSQVQQITKQEALAEFSRHNQAWLNHAGVPPGTEETQVAKPEAADNQLKLVAPTESTVSGNETVAPSSEQKTGTKATTAPGTGGSATENQQTTVKPVETSAVDQAIQAKLDALEKQLATMQKIIELKDKQLAEMQNPGQGEQITPAATVKSLPPADVKPIEQTPPPVGQNPPVDTTVTPVRPPEPVKPLETAKPAVAQPTLKPEPVAQESDSSYASIIGAIVLALSSMLALMWWRKQKLLEEIDAESMFGNYSIMRNDEVSSQLPTGKPSAGATGAAAVSAAEPMVEESSFLNNFKPSDFESFESFNVDHGDIDPVAEADVYLAYGRYQQAEDLMKQAVVDSPERDECKLKLLEIYQASANKDAFEGYAVELAAAGKNADRDFWDKVIELSKDISENAELFAASSEPAVFSAESEVLGENVLLGNVAEPEKPAQAAVEDNYKHMGAATFGATDSDGEESTFASSLYRTPASPQSATDGEESTFASSLYRTPAASLQPPDSTSKLVASSVKENKVDLPEDNFDDDGQNNESLDIDLGPYPGSSQNKVTENDTKLFAQGNDNAQSNSLNHRDDLDAYEFDFDVETEPKKPSDSAKPSTVDSWDPDQTIDFSFDEKTDKYEQKPFESAPLDFSFDLDAPSLETSAKLADDKEAFKVSDLTDMDEMETKLDLAKAYVDMGDLDSAKDILSQVIEKGSDEQKKTAKMLIKEL